MADNQRHRRAQSPFESQDYPIDAYAAPLRARTLERSGRGHEAWPVLAPTQGLGAPGIIGEHDEREVLA